MSAQLVTMGYNVLHSLFTLACRVLDVLFAWAFYLPPALDVAAIGLVTGLIVNLLLKYCSDQAYLRVARQDLDRLAELQRLAAAEPAQAEVERLARLFARVSAGYVWAGLRPSLWLVPAIAIIALWLGVRFAENPVRPGDVVEVTAVFADGATGLAHIVPAAAFTFASAPVAIVAPASASAPAVIAGHPVATWRLRFVNAGEATLRIRFRDDERTVIIAVTESGGVPPPSVTTWADTAGTHIRALHLGLSPRVAPSGWNLYLGWVTVYLAAAIGFGVLFRRWLAVA